MDHDASTPPRVQARVFATGVPDFLLSVGETLVIFSARGTSRVHDLIAIPSST